MGSADKNGIWKYDNSDSVNGWPNYMNLGTNSVSNALTDIRPRIVYTATSQSDANAQVTNLKNNVGITPSTTSPLFFWRTDTKSLWTYDNATWSEIGNTHVIVGTTDNLLIQTGTWTYSSTIAANSQIGNHTFTFPVPYASPPNVVISTSSARVTCEAKSITTTEFTGNGFNTSAGASSYGVTMTWLAMGLAS